MTRATQTLVLHLLLPVALASYPCFGATIIVTTTADSGAGSLRQAITDSNGSTGVLDTIAFSINASSDPGCDPATGVCTIQPSSPLPTVTDPVIIDGYTQPGAQPNTLTNGDNAALKIVLNASGVGTQSGGLVLASNSNTVKGLVVNQSPGWGIWFQANNNLLEGCFVGTDASGTKALANHSGVGLGDNNTVGGTSPAARNVISGNMVLGVAGWVGGNGNSLMGNFIGTDSTGTNAMGNYYGVEFGGGDNTVGGTAVGAGNVISGNGQDGLNFGSPHNVVQGNFIGTDVTGTHAIGNLRNGISISGIVGFSNGTSNTIGGTTASARNVISGNAGWGVSISGSDGATNAVVGNFIGTDVRGLVAIPNGGGVLLGGPKNTAGGTVTGAGNLISGNTGDGVAISAANQNLVVGNLIGTDVTGTNALANGTGISISGGSQQNTIGGASSVARNIVAGNTGDGLTIVGPGSPNNTVSGNFIGTDVTGAKQLGNGGNGVDLVDADGNTIGGNAIGAGNVISGNLLAGVAISNQSAIASNNVVANNFIGTDASGGNALGNGGDGIAILGASTNMIGGTGAHTANVIAWNQGSGVGVVGDSATGNRILGNSIYSNSGLGIDLGDDGVTLNHNGGGTTGPNMLQNFPVLTSVVSSGGFVTIKGILNGASNSTYRIEFFTNQTCDPDGYGQGAGFYGTTSATTDPFGNTSFTAVLPGSISPTTVLTSTATDTNGNTSEFSQCISAGAVASPQIIAIQLLSSTNVVIEYISTPGAYHALERSGNLVLNNWSVLVSNVLGNGSVMEFTNSVAPSMQQMFYRIRAYY